MRNINVIEESGVRDNTAIISPSTVNQLITISTDDVVVTCENPHVVCIEQDAAADVYIKLVGESTFTKYRFQGCQERVMSPFTIGGSTTGTTSGTIVSIRGVKW